MPVSGYPGASATRRDVVERDRGVGDGSFTLPAVDPLHRRRPSFRTGRQQSGLPVFLLPADNISSTSTLNAASAAAFPASQRPSTTFPILSHLPAPFPRPQVNYKHLYLVNQIIRERFITGDQRPTILEAAVSLKNGGLDGHREGVYCLQVVNFELSIPISNKQPVSPRRSVDGAAQPVSIEGREWVFSGSRDRTIRLWDLNTARVIKIYQSPSADRGHTGSVLTLHARAYEGEGGKAKGMRMISGGSDGKLVIWDVLTGAIEGEIKAHEDRQSVLSVRFDEKRIVSCSKGQFGLRSSSRRLCLVLVLTCICVMMALQTGRFGRTTPRPWNPCSSSADLPRMWAYKPRTTCYRRISPDRKISRGIEPLLTLSHWYGI